MELLSNRKTEPVVSISVLPASVITNLTMRSQGLINLVQSIDQTTRSLYKREITANEAYERYAAMADSMAKGQDDDVASSQLKATVLELASLHEARVNGAVSDQDFHYAMVNTATYVQAIAASARASKRSSEEGEMQKRKMDITQRFTSFAFEECDDKADKFKISFKNNDLSLLDEPMLRRGNFLEIQWGYPGNMSRVHRAVIQRIRGFETLTIEALSMMATLHKIRHTRSYEGKSRGEIAEKIAEDHGYQPEEIHIDPDLYRIKEPLIQQARQTDAEFMQTISGGSQFYIDPDGFHFTRRSMKASRRTFTWYIDKKGELLSVDINFDTTGKKSKGDVTAKGIDPSTGKPFEAKGEGKGALDSLNEMVGSMGGSDDTKAAETAAAADPSKPYGFTMAQFDPEYQLLYAPPSFDVVPTPDDNKEKAQQKVNEHSASQQAEVLKLTLEILGDPTIVAKQTYSVQGISKTFSGDYYAKEVTHTIDGGGYKVKISGVKAPLPSAVGKGALGNGDGKDDPNAKGDEAKLRLHFATFDPEHAVSWTGGATPPPFQQYDDSKRDTYADYVPEVENGKVVALRSPDGSDYVEVTTKKHTREEIAEVNGENQ